MKVATLEALDRVCQGLVHVAGMVRNDTTLALATNDHVEVIKHYNHLRLAAESIKESREAIQEISDRLSKEQVPDVMRAAGVKTITVEGVGRVTVSHRFSCSMLDKDEGFGWLRSNGHGSLITETVNSSTLSAFAKDMLEAHGTELPTEIFKVGTSPYTSITKVK